jgi:tetratricopeptide (TPR) repeat protein
MANDKSAGGGSSSGESRSKGGTPGGTPGGAQPQPRPATPAVAHPPPLYRTIDWWTLAVTTLLSFLAYFWTLAPDLTLEDSGELAVASYYAGVPHPPGYPVWTLYTWLFTVLLPFSNIAWRVAVSSAVAGALSCGLLALIVSRGSSMMMEGIAEFRGIDRRWENLICIVSGFVAGMLMAFNGFMWSQALIVEVYTLSVLSLLGVLCCLLRWLYAPQQRRYVYAAFFLFGICFTNHQTLIVAAMGIEVLVAAAQPKLGRDLFLANSVVYLIGLVLKAKGVLTSFDSEVPGKMSMLFIIYNCVGLGSIAMCVWLWLRTKELLTEWAPMLWMGLCWLLGAAFYMYMPIASMTNPPLNWGYPREWDGFIHAFSRGQYEKTNPTDIFSDPFRFFTQLQMLIEGAVEEFNLVYLLIGLIPFAFFRRMQARERAWLTGLSAIYLCLAVLLLILLNPSPDRTVRGLVKVFFAASHVVIAIGIGYGLTLISAVLATQYARYRPWLLYGGAVACGIALYGIASTYATTLFPLTRFAALYVLVVTGLMTGAVLVCRAAAPLGFVLGVAALMPIYSAVAHWADNEQRGHLFGYWFGHDMFTPPFSGADGKPLYPEMARDAVLFGGTDPGRFCPTYMIFCESFLPPRCKPRDPKFDRRDVYLITQNALADGTYLQYIRAHYNRSTQVDTPFFQEMLRPRREREAGGRVNAVARAVAPLDRFFTRLGERFEASRRAAGVYPRKEINTPTAEDSQRCFTDYMADAHRRKMLNQLRPGEDVSEAGGRVQVKGQVAVMQINGLLTKVIFDKNPDHEFYVEESFPLDWMYPHLSPFGIIMKINRQPLEEVTEEMVSRDHEFWSQYSERLIGNWITYDTPISNLCAFAEATYLRRDLTGFKGDPKFVRDDDAQKAFSKLRSSIGGIYAWRVSNAKTPVEQQRMLREAEFAFRQSFAFCPYSPEAVYRYVNLLAGVGRFQDALLIATTCEKLDPYNTQVASLVRQLEDLSRGRTTVDLLRQQIAQLEVSYQANPANFSNALLLASAYGTLQQTSRAVEILDKIVGDTNADVNVLLNAANFYVQLNQAAGLEVVLRRVIQAVPANPEAWYDLSAVQASLGKNTEAIGALRRCLELNTQRLATNPAAKDLHALAATDARFTALRTDPEFQKLFAPK